jgi:murein DD-endopeptidase MepM/ murein hydrolase activator NlpD
MEQKTNKFLTFMKRNAVYLILSLCIIAVGVAITLMLLNREVDGQASIPNDQVQVVDPVPDTPSSPVEKPDDTIITEPVVAPITFIMPVENPTSIGAYSETMVFNSTLGRFSSHMAIDFFAGEGTDVLAVYGGTVKSVETTLLKGTTVVIDHGDGLMSVYNSLADGESVSVGQKVAKGDVIGKVSLSNRQESGDGAHLHFEVMENGKYIDPAKYLELIEK